MAISTFTELQTAIANWLNRSDLSARIPEFITLAEARMNRDGRLRSVDSVFRETIDVVANDQFASLPSDFARMINVEISGSAPVDVLEPLSPSQMDAIRAQEATGTPRYYCVLGEELEIVPVPTSAIVLDMIYYRRITSLSAGNPSNWLLVAAPDIYLYACLAEAQPFLHEDERLPIFESLYGQRCAEYAASSEEDQNSGALVVRSPTMP